MLKQWLGAIGRRLHPKPNIPGLRDAVLDDLPYIAHLLHVEMLHGHFFGLGTCHEVCRYIDDLRNIIQSLEKGETNVAATVHTITVGGSPVGFYVLMGTQQQGLVDFNVLIIEQSWRRRGLAAYTVMSVRSSLRERGYKMAVRCLPNSVGMMALLERLGFEEIHPRQGTVRHYQS